MIRVVFKGHHCVLANDDGLYARSHINLYMLMTQGMDRHSETEIPYFQEFYFEK